MKKHFVIKTVQLILFAAALLLVFASCGKNAGSNNSAGDPDYNNIDDTITLEAIVSPEADSAKIIVRNDGRQKISFGELYYIQRKTDGGWKDVKELVDHSVNAVLFQAPAGDSFSFDVNWSYLYGALEAGEYRIVKPYQKGEVFVRDGETFYAFAEFTVNAR